MTRFFKGIFKLRPTKAKYNSIWDIEVVLKWAEELEPLDILETNLDLQGSNSNGIGNCT